MTGPIHINSPAELEALRHRQTTRNSVAIRPTVAVMVVDIRVNNCANSLQHWRVVSKHRKAVRAAVELKLRQYEPLPMLPAIVTMTRISPGKMDYAGVVNALKSVQDQVSDHYGVDDGKEDVWTWVYRQRKEKRHAVEIKIETAP